MKKEKKKSLTLNGIFKLKQNNTTVRTEIIAGLTTFLAMAYILAVNPSLLSQAGMPASAVFAATAISAAFATLIMAFFANYPVALASGMGLNAYFAYSVVPQLAEQGITDPWRVALTAILFEGMFFILLSIVRFREILVNKVPKNLKLGISAGIGLFITIVGLEGSKVVVDHNTTLLTLGDMGSAPVVLSLVGIVIIAILWRFKIKGAILIGIVSTWVFGMIAELGGWYQVDPAAGFNSVIPNFDNYAAWTPIESMAKNTFCQFDFQYVVNHGMNFTVIVFAFLFVDLFDTVGTLIGVAQEGGMLDKNGHLPRVGRALMADAVGTVAGSLLGTSTVSSYVESATGVAAGGRTGLTALSTAVLFLLSIPLYPVFLAIPSFATTPALVFVGLMMIKNVTEMDFSSDIADSVGGFLAIVVMPFTYSIANGIMFGILAWVILKVLTGKIRDIHPVMWVSFLLFGLRIVTIIRGVSS